MEYWQNIKGFEGYYKASSQGRVKSLERTITRINGRVHLYKEKLLRPIKTSSGALRVVLSKDNNKRPIMVDILIAGAFCPNDYDDEFVVHLDHDVSNNLPSNLIWVDRETKSSHIKKMGVKRRAPRLKYREVLAIKAMYTTERFTQKRIGEIFGVTATVITKIINGHTYQGL